MKVAINGMGIAGPTLAYWLRQSGHEPVIFERAPAIRTGGYLIDFWGLGYDIAERMGLIPTLRAHSYRMQHLRMVDGGGREEAHMDLSPLYDAQRGRFLSLARADLASALAGACEGIPIHFNTSINAIAQQDDGATVTLSSGRQERFDLIVGADGLHSQVRTLAFGPHAEFERFMDCYVAALRYRDKAGVARLLSGVRVRPALLLAVSNSSRHIDAKRRRGGVMASCRTN